MSIDDLSTLSSALWNWIMMIWNFQIIPEKVGSAPWYPVISPGISIGNIALMLIIIRIIFYIIELFYKHKRGGNDDDN